MKTITLAVTMTMLLGVLAGCADDPTDEISDAERLARADRLVRVRVG